MLILEWIAVGIVVLLVGSGLLLQRRLRPRLDTTIRVGGYTVAQVKAIRRDLFAGRLPADPSLHPIALVVAKQAVHNIPIQLRYLPLIYGGIALGLICSGWGSSTFAPVLLIMGVVFLGLDAYIVIVSLRALRNSRKVLAANPAEAPTTE